jgi:hypothetical protein
MSDKTNINFIHRQSAHCESGSTSNLLLHFGIDMSEPMVFGIGAGLFFGFFPLVKIQGYPFITYRNTPGSIMRKTAKRLGVTIDGRKFSNPDKAMDALDEMLDRGIPVGVQTGIYWLPYVPDAYRFHFNMHNIVVYGKKGNDYLISDPVFDVPVTCPAADLRRARYAEGLMAPKGKMLYMSGTSGDIDLPKAIKKGITDVCRIMNVPVPIMGVRGIDHMARQLKTWPKKYGNRKSILYLAHAIRMQEEIGTGGGGFRLLYAAFLQEAGRALNKDSLLDISKRMTGTGDTWRQFAVAGARICKNRSLDGEDFNYLSEIVSECAVKERQLYRDLKEAIR